MLILKIILNNKDILKLINIINKQLISKNINNDNKELIIMKRSKYVNIGYKE